MKKQINFKDFIKVAYCETNEERRARYKELGLSDEEIDRLLLELPEGFQAGQKLFTQADVTKFRADERRKVESNLRHQQQPQTQPPVTDPVQGQPPNSQTQQPTQTAGLTPEQIQALVADQVQGAVTTALETQKTQYEQTINTLKSELDNVATLYNTDKQKAYEKRKAEILAELPETVHKLVSGDTIEALEDSFATVKAFIDTTKAEAQTNVTAQEAKKEHDKKVFYTADDGTEYLTVQELTKNLAHLQEWKAKQR
jgi:hypothetical protein